MHVVFKLRSLNSFAKHVRLEQLEVLFKKQAVFEVYLSVVSDKFVYFVQTIHNLFWVVTYAVNAADN